MGYRLMKEEVCRWFGELERKYEIWAPKCFPGTGCYADTDVVRYAPVHSPAEIEFAKRSDYSFKEALLPIRETMFYFADGTAVTPGAPRKPLLIFLRACERNAVRRLDDIYLHNGPADPYYARRRENAVFALLDCPESCASGFCVDMGSNITDDYDFCLAPDGDSYLLELRADLPAPDGTENDFTARFAERNEVRVKAPDSLPTDIAHHPLWKEYDSRCIGCGRCNFVCPTCTCFTTQDIRTADDSRLGERRRVWASCQVDGYSDIAGGTCRRTHGERMRFKVLHKLVDHKERFGMTMCVGCGRCDDICPEYISYAALADRLGKGEY